MWHQKALLHTLSLAQFRPHYSAIETYGLRRVHLHSQGLGFEVAFVIADVVTPLLGLDSLLQESLSLHVGQNSKHYLVSPGGARTQLEHMGKHLYLIACPSKLGSSNCILSSLPRVIGFLPADMKLENQKVALSSSSSGSDLVEDLTEQEASKDGWNLQCHPVLEEASEEEAEPSFDLVPGREEVADAGGEPSAAKAIFQTITRASQHDSHSTSTLVCGLSGSKRQSFSAQEAESFDQNF